MAVPENVQLQVAVNAGAPQTGGLTVDYEDTIQLSLVNTAGVRKARWEIYDFPVGWSTPSGWALDSAAGVIYVVTASGAPPPSFDLPASPLWGKWGLSVEVNDRLRGGTIANDLFDKATSLSIEGPGGVVDTLFGEEGQFGGVKQWNAELKKNWRILAASAVGGGGLTPPTDPTDDGKLPIASGGDLAYLAGTAVGQLLQWNGSAWVAYAGPNQAPVTYSDAAVIAQLSDGGKYVRLTHAEPDFEIPPNDDVAFPVGTQIVVVGTQGSFTVTEGDGVTVNIPPSRSLASFEAFSSILLKKVDTDEWDLMGDLALA